MALSDECFEFVRGMADAGDRSLEIARVLRFQRVLRFSIILAARADGTATVGGLAAACAAFLNAPTQENSNRLVILAETVRRHLDESPQ
jgi:hypothetical protein